MIRELSIFDQLMEKYGFTKKEREDVGHAFRSSKTNDAFKKILKDECPQTHETLTEYYHGDLNKLWGELNKSIENAGKYAKDKLTRDEVKKIDAMISPILARHAQHNTLAGSYRRGKQIIGDVDYVVTDANLENILAEIQTHCKVLEVSRQGSSVMTVVLRLGKKEAQVEFLNVKVDEYGSAMLHSTGSGEFNQGIRGFAKGKGLILNQHGLFVVADKKRLASAFEYQIFEELGLKPIPPERRDDSFSLLKKEFMKDPKKNIHTAPKIDKGGKTWKVQSKSDPSKKYIVTLAPDGKWNCRVDAKKFEWCKGYFFSKDRPKTCRHIQFVQKKVK